MKRRELYRMLIADYFDLLEPDEQEEVAKSLRHHPEVDAAQFMARIRESLGGRADDEREQQFLRALEEAERGHLLASVDVGDAPASPRHAGGLGGRWRLGLAAAAGAAVVWVSGQFWPQPTGPQSGGTLVAPSHVGSPAPARATRTVFLNVTRDASDAIDLEATSATHVTFIAEARLEASSVRLELRNSDEALLASRDLEFAPGDPVLRLLALDVTKDALVGHTFWLILKDTSSQELRRWSIAVQ